MNRRLFYEQKGKTRNKRKGTVEDREKIITRKPDNLLIFRRLKRTDKKIKTRIYFYFYIFTCGF